MILSCSNYWCECYKNNTCARCLEHRLKLYEKRLDDNCIPKRNNIKKCELHLPVEDNKHDLEI